LSEQHHLPNMPPVAYNPHIIVHSLVSSMTFSSSASGFMFQLESANMRSSSKSQSLICGRRESFYQRDQLAKRTHELPACITSSSLGICRSVLHAPLQTRQTMSVSVKRTIKMIFLTQLLLEYCCLSSSEGVCLHLK
jgi:hypothetical protein